MQTLDEAIEKKQATVYLDTKPEFVDAIHRYNKKMWVGREKRDRLNRIGTIYCLVYFGNSAFPPQNVVYYPQGSR